MEQALNVTETFYNYLNNTKSCIKQIETLKNSNERIFKVDLADLKRYSNQLYFELIHNYFSKTELVDSAFKNFVSKNSGPLDFQLCFENLEFKYSLRDLKSKKMGSLISFYGTVTRSSVVRPELLDGVFLCKNCGTKSKKIKQEFKYTEPMVCTNNLCTNRKNWELKLDESVFSNWQKIIVQENSDEIPPGALPRTIEVVLRNELVETIKPGTTTLFTGTLIVVPEDIFLMLPQAKALPMLSGVKSQFNVKNLNQKFLFLCNNVKLYEKKEENVNEVLSKFFCEESTNESENISNNLENISNKKTGPNFYSFSEKVRGIYEKLSESLFPNIFGHRNIKNAILLMLVGGVRKSTQENMKLRGDINLLLVGDPGTAKSQFLKQTSQILERSIYTCGKSSSAAGLTACVVKDENNEFTIEAGALMLSDNGFCCIDEFDKMNYKDQVSIHEAMEQQTISISKAGINATLNAKCSILAAANPINGRYDKNKTLRQNINLSAPIMSRFDLFFVLIDEIDKSSDENIADFILKNHTAHLQQNSYYDLEEIRTYIRYCRELTPILSQQSKELLLTKYLILRQESLLNNQNYRITVRSLESLIRLSEALAKIHCEKEVKPFYVEEAFRLMKSSVLNVKKEDLVIKTEGVDKKIAFKDYERITNTLIYILKTKENVTKDQLIMEYLKNVEDVINSENEYFLEKQNVEDCVEFLVEKEGVLYENEGLVFIHPNFDV